MVDDLDDEVEDLHDEHLAEEYEEEPQVAVVLPQRFLGQLVELAGAVQQLASVHLQSPVDLEVGSDYQYVYRALVQQVNQVEPGEIGCGYLDPDAEGGLREDNADSFHDERLLRMLVVDRCKR